MARSLRSLLVCFLLLGSGCDLVQEEEPFAAQVVVESVLVAGEPLPRVRLFETAPVDEPYVPREPGVVGAGVAVLLLAADGSVEARFPYEPHPEPEEAASGQYVAAERHEVLPERTYRLEVEVPEALGLVSPGALVRAEATVPSTFRVVRPPPDTVRYDIAAEPPTLDVTRGRLAGTDERPTAYVFVIDALEPDAYDLTPFLADLLDEDDDPAEFIQGASPILNEGNYTVNPDGTLALRVPWFAISYYGPNRLTANALGDALYDFLRTREVQVNPSTLSPGEIQNVVTNVENGAGVFGSLARAEVEVFVAP